MCAMWFAVAMIRCAMWCVVVVFMCAMVFRCDGV